MLDKLRRMKYIKNIKRHDVPEKGGAVVNIDKLKGKLVEKKKTYEGAAKVIGISVTAFNNKMQGRSMFDCAEAVMLSDWLGLTNDEKIDIFLR